MCAKLHSVGLRGACHDSEVKEFGLLVIRSADLLTSLLDSPIHIFLFLLHKFYWIVYFGVCLGDWQGCQLPPALGKQEWI